MTVQDWLWVHQKQLEDAGIATSRLDCLVLLEDALGKDRTHLLAHPELELTPEQQKLLDEQLQQRAQHIPLAYIRGKSEFYGREFIINHHVLEPRPESETMIDLLKNLPLKAEPNNYLLDVGTGSGALGITAALELPSLRVSLLELDPLAMTIAKQNAGRYKLDLQFIESDLLQKIGEGEYDIILANLPYVPSNFQVNPAAMNEPRLAIFGGEDGLDLYRTLFKQAARLQQPPRFILTEALPPQHEELAHIASRNGFQQQKSEDFVQVFTFCKA